MQLQPLASVCYVSGQPFVEGNRVASHLVTRKAGEVVRCDMLATEQDKFIADGVVVCRWVQVFKLRKANENADRALKLTAETLFVTLADPTSETTPESARLLQFLALMLERKRVLRPKGRTADGARNVVEHAKTKWLYEVPAGELTPEFFIQVQAQLSVLVGEPKPKTDGAASVVTSPETPVGGANPGSTS